MILGIDLGNFSVKTSEKFSFISKLKEGVSFSEKNNFTLNGINYSIGDGEFSTDWNKSRKENLIPMLFYSIAKCSTEDINQVVVGLPIQQYKAEKEALKGYIEGNRVKEIIIDGKKRNILISDVEIAPEGAAAYYNLSLDNKNKIGKRQLLIIDVGGLTSDICLFKDRAIIDVKTVPVGMLNIYQEIVDHINSKYVENFKLEDGEEVLRDGLLINGEFKDISFIRPILIKNFNSIWKEVQLKFNTSNGYVLLTGGGSNFLKQAFKNRLGNNLLISEDPLFDNAIGFKKAGESLWLER